MKGKYCIPCKIEGKLVLGDNVVDNMLMCKEHKRTYRKLNSLVDEDFED